MKIITNFGLLGAIIGYFLNVTGYLDFSYIIWLTSNTLWVYYNYKIKEWKMLIMFIIYDGFCIYGLLS